MISLPLDGLGQRIQELVEQVISTREPALIASAEEPAAVVMPAREYALQQQRLALLERIAREKSDLSAGRFHSQDDAERLIDEWISGAA